MRRADPIGVDLLDILRLALRERKAAVLDELSYRGEYRAVAITALDPDALIDALRDELRRRGLNADTTSADDAQAAPVIQSARLGDGVSVATGARQDDDGAP